MVKKACPAGEKIAIKMWSKSSKILKTKVIESRTREIMMRSGLIRTPSHRNHVQKLFFADVERI